VNATELRTRNPEWFIGGPLHGQDKLAHPALGGVNYTHLSTGPDSPDTHYAMRRFAIGRTMLTLWVYNDVDEPEAGALLAEIMLAPHQVAID
jgi:hypothetical protein